jgi:DNA repair photolyase
MGATSALDEPQPRYREEPCKGAINRVSGMPFRWSLNPYMGCEHRCTFCYVRAFEMRAERPSGEAYGRSIRVKTNIADVLRLELRRPSWRREEVAIGTATDPYQPAEGTYRLTRACIGRLSAAHNPFSVISRGPMVVRDIDVLVEAGRRASVSVSLSIPTLDEHVWRTTEPGTASPRQRLRAMERLAAAGVQVAVAVAPIIPGLSDDPASLARVFRAAREHGATRAWARLLDLRPGTREHFLSCLSRDWPSLAPSLEAAYERPFASSAARTALEKEARALREIHGLDGREARAASWFPHQMDLFELQPVSWKAQLSPMPRGNARTLAG